MPIEGWDFSFHRGRVEDQPLPWIYQDVAGNLVAQASRVLDVDTGGGEIFGSLRPPAGSVAVEPYRPNVAVASGRLEPHGIRVIERETPRLPVDDGAFDLVLNRHGYLNPAEMHRALEAGGRLLTQQVCAINDVEFNQALGIPPDVDPTIPSTLGQLVDDLQHVGLVVDDAREAAITTRYLDIGAVIYQLRIVSWHAPGFDPDRHRSELRQMHDQIVDTGGFEVRSRRFLVQASK
ncbi:class I SAM-dependent methyltransferase [Kribbella sp. NBC_01484]|uniref:class I SAM-dependent methyltransferase n=1 Tax=Kribbella sp. NBC_01484 TaxID=2903579 RepID=UPI002E331BEC|nr:hypothetical protein [Kribbella sp. NBC_01484]